MSHSPSILGVYPFWQIIHFEEEMSKAKQFESTEAEGYGRHSEKSILLESKGKACPLAHSEQWLKDFDLLESQFEIVEQEVTTRSPEE